MATRSAAPARAASEPRGAAPLTGRVGPTWLPAYVALAFLISWGWLVPVALTAGAVEAGVGWPTHVPALLGPMAAALLVTARTGGRAAVLDLWDRMVLVRVPLRWWAVGLSPVLLLLIVGAAAALGWTSLDLSGLALFPGVPSAWGAAGVALTLILVNGLGEETGWRGYVQPALQRRHSPLVATLGVAAIWAAWHLPMFLVLASFRSFGAVTLVGWGIGLLSGAVVLAWLYNRSDGSILLVALWHAGYNLLSATAIGAGFLGAASTVLVILGATVLVVLELVRTRSGRSSVLLPESRPSATALRRTERGDSRDI